jgi:hypothetical protein
VESFLIITVGGEGAPGILSVETRSYNAQGRQSPPRNYLAGNVTGAEAEPPGFRGGQKRWIPGGELGT